MKEIQTIEFVDAETKEAGVAVVRADKGIVSLTLSLEKNADVEVFVAVDIGRALMLAIDKALVLAASSKS